MKKKYNFTELLAKIQKALDEYLERKRSSSPRFYFVQSKLKVYEPQPIKNETASTETSRVY